MGPCRFAVVVVALLAPSCAQTDLRGRDVLRVAAYRQPGALSVAASAAAPRIDAGTDALTDDELRAVADAVGARFAAAVGENPGDVDVDGEARVTSCRLRAGPGRAVTLYEAKCRAAIVLRGVPLVEVETIAVRKVRAKGVTPGEAARIAKMERNPLLTVDDARAALESAATAAAALIVTGRPPRRADDEVDPPLRLADDEARRLALLKLDRSTSSDEQAAAAVDLGRAGRPEDAAELVPFLDDDSVLVRRATAAALGQLLDARALPSLQAKRDDPDPLVRRLIELAIERTYALFPERRARGGGAATATAGAAATASSSSASSDTPSNRSTVGARGAAMP